MPPRIPQRRTRPRSFSRFERDWKFLHPLVERLEDRTLLDSGVGSTTPTVVVGRTLSAYFAGDVQNGQVTITYTVYNEQADDETGVLLTTTLESGVTIDSASVNSGVTTPLPDQQGQNLAWSLGTIQGYDRESVTLVVDLASTSILQLDSGAKAYATLDAGAVSASTPAATLRAGSHADPSLLASTPDANTTDPFVQEEAAALGYDPTAIFNFLHDQIGYNSYLGSVRGARGTLWSDAGNALDVASLGVALMRASGIPAQYVQGTLPSYVAQTLILSMFPASDQTVGYIPAGTQTADPKDDPQLLAETESHYWFQYDAGQSFVDADPLLSATTGRTYTTAGGTFSEVPDNLREKTEVTLDAEIYSQAAAAFGGAALQTTTVLDQTFNDVDLVGRPLTIGNFVSSNEQGGLAYTTAINTYSPYIEIGDTAYESNQDQIIRGQNYQETLTNFPLGSQILSGLFLNFIMSGPEGTPINYTKTLVDRLGFAFRQNGGSAQLPKIDPTSPPIISPFDLYTASIDPGGRALNSLSSPGIIGNAAAEFQAFANEINGATSEQQDAIAQAGLSTITNTLIAVDRYELADFEAQAQFASTNIANENDLAAYFDRPRITIASNSYQASADDDSAEDSLVFGFDLLRSTARTEVAQGQALTSAIAYNIDRGIIENGLEDSVVSPPPNTGLGQTSYQVFTGSIFNSAASQGIPSIVLSGENSQLVDQLPFSDDVKARISDAISSGKKVIVPSREVLVNGQNQIGWYEINQITGETTGVLEDGSHGDLLDYVYFFVSTTGPGVRFSIGLAIGSQAAIFGAISKVFNFSQEHNFFGTSGEAIKKILANASILIAQNALLTSEPFDTAFVLGYEAGVAIGAEFILKEPPLPSELIETGQLVSTNIAINPGTTYASNITPSMAESSISITQLAVDGELSASWNSSGATVFESSGLKAGDATVLDSNGRLIGAGSISLSIGSLLPMSLSGDNAISVSGSGSLSFYGPAERNLGVSGDWKNYNATITGNVALTLSSANLYLNGVLLPFGSYTINTLLATVTGSGSTNSPTFSGSVSISASNANVELGPWNGVLAIGGMLNSENGATVDGYGGSISASANGDGTLSCTLNGKVTNVLQIMTSSSSLTTNQNAPATFHLALSTSLSDVYRLTTQAPIGWTVALDTTGTVTVTPAPGLQSGTYPIQIIAQSTTDSDLETQSIVYVTIMPTTNGLSLGVVPDPLITVPFNGADLPTAFNVTLQNKGPSSLDQTLTISNVPAGFTTLTSATSVTVPAGETGSVGVYLIPTGQIPAPGTVLSFTVSTGPYLLASTTETFTVPEIHSVTLTSDLPSQNAAPGSMATDRLTITDVGNVPEVVTLSSSASSGLTVAGLSNLSLQPGQSVVETVTLTPDASTPLNSFLAATFTATYGPAGSPLTTTLQLPVDVVVPGALAIAQASASATQLGETGLADRLNDLGLALTNLVQTPTSAVYLGQALASLDSVLAQIPADPYLSPDAAALAADRAALAQATTSTEILAAVNAIGTDLGPIGTTLTDEVEHTFTLQITPNQSEVRPGVPAYVTIVLQNTGTQATTYDLSVSGLPSTVTASFNESSVTLQPGQSLDGGPNGITLTLVETGGALVPTNFTVTATVEGAPEIMQSAAGTLTVPEKFVQVAVVTSTPSFTNAGGLVDIQATVIQFQDQPLDEQVGYQVVTPGGVVAYTSALTPLSLYITRQTVDLGDFNTTGLANGSYTIHVTVYDTSGNPISDSTGQVGSLLIGSPVSATITTSALNSLDPTATFPYQQSTTNTIQVNTQETFPAPLTLAGIAATDSSVTDVALDGMIAYACGATDISIVNVSDPTNPTVLGTFGQDLLNPNGDNICRVSGDLLLVASEVPINAADFELLIYSIANPTSPVLLSNTQYAYSFINDMLVQGTTAFFPLGGVNTFVGIIDTGHYGNFVSVDFSNPAAPHLDQALFNADGTFTGDNHFESGVTAVNGGLDYIASTQATGPSTTGLLGELLIVDTANPSAMSLVGTLDIPSTVELVSVAIDGDRALVVGSTGGESIYTTNDLQLAGNLTLTMLDISDPLHPTILGSTVVTQDQYFDRNSDVGNYQNALALGNGTFAISDTQVGGKPVILLVNASDPDHMVFGVIDTPSPVNGMTDSGGLLYAGGVGSLSIYDIGHVVGVPLTISAEVPNDANTPYVLSSFSLPPSEITLGANFDTLTWVTSLGFGVTGLTLSWTTDLDNLLEGEVRYVTLGSQVDFIDDGTPGTIELPPTDVTVYTGQNFNISPISQTTQPGAPATYSVGIGNYTRFATVTYDLSVVGLPAAWVNLPSTIEVAPGGGATVPLVITPTAYTPDGTYGFTFILTDGTITESGKATLIVQGLPILPDADSHGIVATLIPTSATAGQGTLAQYVVELTNTGSADDTFSLAALGLPAGVTAAFGQATIDVPPGASNFRDVTLTLSVPAGTALGTFAFQVSATSTTLSSVSTTTQGSLDIVPEGVSVGLSPGSAAPGGTFELTVTNTGQVTDTFTLALGGPAALVASLGLNRVTLAPGASQVIPISTNGVNFAVPGGLNFTASATSQTNPAVQAATDGSLTIPTFSGLTAQFSPSVQIIAGPGSASFLLDVNNTGNAEDSYEAIIIGTSGPVTASLTGLDGSPTDEIPLFRLPGLSTGAILLQAAMSALGQGTVTVEIESLTDGSIVATATATINALAAPTITLTPSNASPTYGQSVNFTTTVVADAAGDPVPTGTAQFEVDGVDFGAAIALVNGAATSTGIATLAAGQHTIIVNYSGDSTYGPDIQTYTLTVAPAPLTITAADATKVTGQPNPTFSATYSGFVLGQGLGDLAGTLTFTTTATNASPPGDYAITPAGLSSGNYAITFVPGNLAVTKATALVSTSASLTSPDYGQSLTFTATVTPTTSGVPTPTGTVQFLIDGVDFGPAVVLVNGAATSMAVATLAAGHHTVSVVYSGDATFSPGDAPALGEDVAKATLTVTANDTSRAFGQTNPAFTASYSGFVLGQSAGDLAGTLAFSTVATAASPPGTYAIIPSGFSSANYSITFADGTLTVIRASSTVAVVPSTLSPTYGQSLTFVAHVSTTASSSSPSGTVQFEVDGVPLGSPVALVDGFTTSPAIADLAAGSHSITASYSGDVDFAASSAPVTSSVVAKAALTVKANDAAKAAGQANPAFSASYSGFVLGQSVANLTGILTFSTNATATSVPGQYAITPGGLSSTDYAITFVPGTLTVTVSGLTGTAIAVAPSSPGLTYGQTLTLYADVASSVPGQVPPTGTVQFLIDGVAFGPAVALVGGAATSDAIATLAAGTHTVTAVYSGDSAFASSTSTVLDEAVAKAPLTVTANDATKLYGQANPAFSASYAGFVLGQGVGSLAGSLSLATTATAASRVGSYPITAGGLTSPNYSITFVAGILAVTPAPLTVSAPDLAVPYGSPIPALAATYSGFVNGDSPASLTTQAVLATAATSTSPAGSYTITAGGASSPDYAITYQDGLLTITAAASPTVAPGLSAFVTQLYREVLGREPEPSGLAYWLQRLATDETYAQVSKGFFASLERRTLQAEHRAPKITQPRALADALHAQVLADVAPAVLAKPGPLALVTTLYREILGRAPDARGLQTLLEELAIGTSPAKVATDLFDSPEHNLLKREHKAPKFSERTALADALKAEKAAQAGITSPTGTSSPTSELTTTIAPSLESELTAFVTTLYREVLGRAPEQSGLANWLQALESGVTPAQANRDFFASPERAALQAEHKAPKFTQARVLSDALRSELFAEISAPVLAEPGPIALVTELYQDILGRTPDPSGEQFFIDLLAIGSSPAEIDSDIYDSPEHGVLRREHKAPRISERAALADALKAEKVAVRINSAYPAGPMNPS